MELPFVPFPLSFPVGKRKTHPLIQCIIDNKQKELEKRVRRININDCFPSEKWDDDVSLLTAATACGNEDICIFLLRQKVDPNTLSTNSLSALDYAAVMPGVPLTIVKRLIAAKANLDGHPFRRYTPLQFAADKGRLDVFKALLEAGANPEINYGLNRALDQKVENLIHQISAGNETVDKCKLFFRFMVMSHRKTQPEVFNFCKEHFLEEHPFIHLLLFERYFNVVDQTAEMFRQSSINWLKDSKKTDIYIEGFIKRFEKIPNESRILALNCFHAVICMIEEIPLNISGAIVPILIKCLGSPSEVTNHLILSIVCVTVEKSLKKKPAADSLHSDVLKDLCSALVPFTDPICRLDVRILTYRLFAALHKFVPEHVNSCKLTSVPDTVLCAVDIRTDEVIKEMLKKLDMNLRSLQSTNTADTVSDAADSTQSKKKKKKKKKKKRSQQDTNSKEDCDTANKSVEESDSTVHSYAAQAEDSPIKRNWVPVSKRWRSKLEELAEEGGEASEVLRLKNLKIGMSSKFEIARGSDGTRVFLGLRDDGTEVAVKRMYATDYQVLKNEKQFLRLPELDNPCIVRYVDFAEDSNYGYLILQLCEYTLEEYIQYHLPEDTLQKELVLNKLVKEVLCSLNALHSESTKVLHRDVKPQNVLIDITGKARLADFGISRRLKSGETTCRTAPAGTKYWKAREILEEDSDSGYKRSSDIQVAGMLIYYILSCGKHPFGSGVRCETNIVDGKYALEYLKDELAKDLVEWMISHEAKDRPTVEDTLCHPFFWKDDCKVEYLKRLGNETDVANRGKDNPELITDIENMTAGTSFADWKTKVPSELVQKLDPRNRAYPENTLGLLRFIRNLHEHHYEEAKMLDLLTIFPDLFENAFKFAKKREWITSIPGLDTAISTF